MKRSLPCNVSALVHGILPVPPFSKPFSGKAYIVLRLHNNVAVCVMAAANLNLPIRDRSVIGIHTRRYPASWNFPAHSAPLELVPLAHDHSFDFFTPVPARCKSPLRLIPAGTPHFEKLCAISGTFRPSCFSVFHHRYPTAVRAALSSEYHPILLSSYAESGIPGVPLSAKSPGSRGIPAGIRLVDKFPVLNSSRFCLFATTPINIGRPVSPRPARTSHSEPHTTEFPTPFSQRIPATLAALTFPENHQQCHLLPSIPFFLFHALVRVVLFQASAASSRASFLVLPQPAT